MYGPSTGAWRINKPDRVLLLVERRLQFVGGSGGMFSRVRTWNEGVHRWEWIEKQGTMSL